MPWYDDGQLSRTVLATETSVNRKQVIKPSFQFEHIQKAVESQNLKLLFTQIWLFDYADLDWILFTFSPQQHFEAVDDRQLSSHSSILQGIDHGVQIGWCLQLFRIHIMNRYECLKCLKNQ